MKFLESEAAKDASICALAVLLLWTVFDLTDAARAGGTVYSWMVAAVTLAVFGAAIIMGIAALQTLHDERERQRRRKH